MGAVHYTQVKTSVRPIYVTIFYIGSYVINIRVSVRITWSTMRRRAPQFIVVFGHNE